MNFYDELLESKEENDTQGTVTAPGLLNAVVKEVWNEDHKGMIKVEYLLGEKDYKTSDWVRVMTPYGGKEYGNYWLPEIDTEVVVGFIQGNLNMPVVLGCLWNDTDTQPTDIMNENNDTKTIMTKAGNKITFTDTEEKEKITVETPAGLTAVLDDEAKSITLQDKDKKNQVLIDCDGGNITLAADTAIKLTAGGTEVLTAKSDTVTVKCDTVELKTSKTLTLKGGSAELSGTDVKVKSSGNLGLQGSGVTQVKGSMVKIN